MPNEYPHKKPLFGKKITDATSGEQQNTRAALSEDKARTLLQKRAQEAEKESAVAVKERAQDEEKKAPSKTQTEETQVKADKEKPPVKQARTLHFGRTIEKPKEDAPKPTEKPLKAKRERRKKVRGTHPVLKKLWSLFFSDTSFRRENYLMPKSAAGVDRLFLFFFIVLLSIGSVMVFSSSYAYAEARYGDSTYFVRRQILFAAIGIGVMLVASMLTVQFYKSITRLAFGVTILLLIAVLLFGVNLNGAQRWIGIGPLTIQPTEIAKLTIVMMLAWYFERYQDKLREHKSFFSHLCYNTLYPGAIIALICALVMLQKHLSGIIILGCIGIIIMFVAGSDGRHLATLMGTAVVGVSCLAIFTDYTKRRIDIWLDPYANRTDGGWQTIQGLNAMGSGGFLGLGIGDSRMKYSYVSEPANDFIFTITCEELGFVGAMVIIAFFALLIWRGFVIAMRNPDRYARLLCLGIVAKIAVQTLLNLAVITNSIPNTGIALPFFSYGGTSLIIQLLEVGIILSISRTSQLQKR